MWWWTKNFVASRSRECHPCHATKVLLLWQTFVTKRSGERCSYLSIICATLPRKLSRPDIWKSLAIFTPTSQQIQMEILVEKREEFLPAGYVVFEKSCPWVTQSLYNLCKTLYDCATRFVFPTKAGNAEILSGGFNDHFSGYWMYGLFMIFDCQVYLGFWTTVPVSRGSYSMPKPREFMHNKSETLFRIASHF